MKNAQICPICGEKIDFIDDYDYFRHKVSYADTINYMLFDKNRIGMCRKCESPVYNTNRKIARFQLYAFIIGLIAIFVIAVITIGKEDIDIISYFVTIIVYYIITQLWFNYNIFYAHRKKQHYIIPTKLKSVFCATFTPNRKTNELFENNILEIKNGNESCKVILIKKVDRNQYTFRFIEYEKDILKDMLEKYDAFQLTNGVDVLGSLEVTHRYPF